MYGVVTRRSAVYPQLQLAHYTCLSSKKTQGPFRIEAVGQTYSPDTCPHCEQGKAFKIHPTLSTYRNFQRLNLQETPGSVPPGRVPRTKEVWLVNDPRDAVRPGEEVNVTGVYEHSYDASTTIKSGFPVFFDVRHGQLSFQNARTSQARPICRKMTSRPFWTCPRTLASVSVSSARSLRVFTVTKCPKRRWPCRCLVAWPRI